jgi:hypothetical protein
MDRQTRSWLVYFSGALCLLSTTALSAGSRARIVSGPWLHMMPSPVDGVLPPLGSSTATFNFACDQKACQFQCKMDSLDWAACTSPAQFPGLSDGSHAFSVGATDSAGQVETTPASVAFKVDTVPPIVTITKPTVLQLVYGPKVTVEAVADEAAIGFECKIDDVFVTCPLSSSKSMMAQIPNLAAGRHALVARAQDVASNWSAPVSVKFTVDPTLPDTAITGLRRTKSQEASPVWDVAILFSSPRANTTFECKVDAGEFAPCSSPAAFRGIAAGEHTIAVRAIDAFGNVDPTPASRTFEL